ncbi:MAG: sugar phosphate isomerase/epimerase [Candidatus Hydrogenedentes bacterium]|nr:sugar phosphate isomerase/epimerase [Candidatus Hydrogenedentota bacterium]
MDSSRRDFIKQSGAAALTLGAAGSAAQAAAFNVNAPCPAQGADMKRTYGISLAAWSLHRTIGKGEGKTPMLDMPKLAREEWDIEGIELVNNMLASTDKSYLDEFAKNAATHNVNIMLIMIDGQGNIGGDTPEARKEAVDKHKNWMNIAADFGCHCVRMNWAGAPKDVMERAGALDEFITLSAPGFQELAEYGTQKNLNVIIENHGGPSSYPEAVDKLMHAVNHPRFGTLPDFGNFPRNPQGEYLFDVNQAIDSLMHYAKAVSAKCYHFDEVGNETTLDYEKIIQIVHDRHGYHGYIGIEYEGDKMSEFEGIAACKKLLERLRQG